MRSLSGILGQQGGEFNPETDITWHSLFWAEGTDFTARGYSDGASVTTWDNETTETNATSTFTAPTFDAVDTNLNNQPSVNFAGDGGGLEITTNFGVDPTTPTSVVVVLYSPGNGTTDYIVDGQNVMGVYVTSNTIPGLNFGGTAQNGSSGGLPSGAHFVRIYADGSTGNDVFAVDGTAKINANAGGNGFQGFQIGSRGDSSASRTWSGTIALVGIYEGDITSDGAWSDFKTWVTDHYGITIS